ASFPTRRPSDLERVTGRLWAALLEATAEEWHQGDRQVRAGHQIVEEVGDQERVAVEVALHGDPEHGGEEDLPEQAEDAGEQDAGPDDQGGAAHPDGAAQATRSRNWSTTSSGT